MRRGKRRPLVEREDIASSEFAGAKVQRNARLNYDGQLVHLGIGPDFQVLHPLPGKNKDGIARRLVRVLRRAFDQPEIPAVKRPNGGARPIALRAARDGEVASRHMDVAMMVDSKVNERVTRTMDRKLPSFDVYVDHQCNTDAVLRR